MFTNEYLFNANNEFLMYSAITDCSYTLEKINDDDAKDLIKRLVQKDPSKRLGNGPQGSNNDIRSLLNHPFFKEIYWELLDSYISPLSNI